MRPIRTGSWMSEDYSPDLQVVRVSQFDHVENYSCMSLIQFLFLVQIIELEKRLCRVESELKALKEEEAAAKKDDARKKDEAAKKGKEAQRMKQTTEDMVARCWKDGG
jgi:hypothetical protein